MATAHNFLRLSYDRLRLVVSLPWLIRDAANQNAICRRPVHISSQPFDVRVSSVSISGCTLLLRNSCSLQKYLSFKIIDRTDNICFLKHDRKLSSRGKGKHLKPFEDLLDYESSDEDRRQVDEDDSEDEDEDDGKPKSWKDVKHTLSGFRADLVLATGLGISRNKVDDAFLSGKLRLNGEKLIKKSKRIEVGDTLDVIKDTQSEEDTIHVMRIRLKKLEEEKSKKDKFVVILRRWKHLAIPKPKQSS